MAICVSHDNQIAFSGLQPIWDACGFAVVLSQARPVSVVSLDATGQDRGIRGSFWMCEKVGKKVRGHEMVACAARSWPTC